MYKLIYPEGIGGLSMCMLSVDIPFIYLCIDIPGGYIAMELCPLDKRKRAREKRGERQLSCHVRELERERGREERGGDAPSEGISENRTKIVS